MSDTYNGWTNRETWAAHVAITNNAVLFETCKGLDGVFIARNFNALGRDTGWLSQSEWVDILLSIGSLWRVNWDEIARALAEGSAP